MQHDVSLNSWKFHVSTFPLQLLPYTFNSTVAGGSFLISGARVRIGFTASAAQVSTKMAVLGQWIWPKGWETFKNSLNSGKFLCLSTLYRNYTSLYGTVNMNIEPYWHFSVVSSRRCVATFLPGFWNTILGIPLWCLFWEQQQAVYDFIEEAGVGSYQIEQVGCFVELQTLAAMANPPHDW